MLGSTLKFRLLGFVMSDAFPVLTKYRSESLPSQFSILTQWNEWKQSEDHDASGPLSDIEASLLAYMASSTRHDQALFEHILPLLASHASWH